MAKMSIVPKDRPKVKAECLRLIMTLKLDADKNELIYSFVDSYLNLTAQEAIIFEDNLSALGADVKENAMEFISSHRREGRHEGKEELLKLLLERRFGTLPETISKRMDRLTAEQLNDFGKSSMFDLDSLSDLERWLDANLPN